MGSAPQKENSREKWWWAGVSRKNLVGDLIHADAKRKRDRTGVGEEGETDLTRKLLEERHSN